MLMMRRLSLLLVALLTPVPIATGAAAQPLRATYEVHALGGTVLELEAEIELTGEGYGVKTALRTRGLAAVFFSGRQMVQARGGFAGEALAPTGYVSEGVWGGRARRLALDWPGGAPRLLDLAPAEASDRAKVLEALEPGAVDVLSLVVGIARKVGQQGRCDLSATVFDGRRRSLVATTSEGRELVRPWRNAWHGEALRCGVTHRAADQPASAEPQRVTAWVAAPYAGAPAIPVRIDIPSRRFGTATAVLLRAEPLERRVELRR